VIYRSGRGKEGVQCPAVRRIKLGDLDGIADPLRRLVQALLGPSGDDHSRALHGENPGGRLADPGTGSDDHYLLSAE
jgi:hypothetical protein